MKKLGKRYFTKKKKKKDIQIARKRMRRCFTVLVEQELQNCVPKWLYHFAFSPAMLRVPVAQQPCQHWVSF